jgi:acyl carrier protein
VVIDHRNAAARAEWIARRYNLGRESVVLHKTPLIFDVAVIELFAPLSVGGTVRLAGPGGEADVGYLSEMLAASKVTFVHFVPSMLKVFLAGIDGRRHPVPPGVPGEICVAALGGLARGYQGRPAETAERFVPNPYPAVPGERLYRTGDYAVRRAADAPLEFLGRADLQTKIRGARVELADVETALAAAPYVADCAVLARGEGAEAELIAYVVGEGIHVEDVARHAAQALPEYMLPAAFVVLPHLPYTGSGKLDRAALPAPTAADRAQRSSSEAPTTPLESEIAADWARALSLEGVGRGDSFFELGGNSLGAAQMLSRVSSAFGIRLPVVSFFRDPTVRGVAAEVERLVMELVAAMPEDDVRSSLAGRESNDGC